MLLQRFKELGTRKCPPKLQSSLCYRRRSFHDYLSTSLRCNRKDLGLGSLNMLEKHSRPSVMRPHEVKAKRDR